MKPFPYDEFYPVFMEELKSIFSRFLDLSSGTGIRNPIFLP